MECAAAPDSPAPLGPGSLLFVKPGLWARMEAACLEAGCLVNSLQGKCVRMICRIAEEQLVGRPAAVAVCRVRLGSINVWPWKPQNAKKGACRLALRARRCRRYGAPNDAGLRRAPAFVAADMPPSLPLEGVGQQQRLPFSDKLAVPAPHEPYPWAPLQRPATSLGLTVRFAAR